MSEGYELTLQMKQYQKTPQNPKQTKTTTKTLPTKRTTHTKRCSPLLIIRKMQTKTISQ